MFLSPHKTQCLKLSRNQLLEIEFNPQSLTNYCAKSTNVHNAWFSRQTEESKLPPKLEKPTISWRNGVPISTGFDDMYYSVEDGEAESEYVFLNGASILENTTNKTHFVIGETGFGTGLNFLTTWQAWRKKKPDCRLIFISAEAFPMQSADLEKAHSAFPALRPLSEQLLAVWPPAAAGTHMRRFDNGTVSLMLLFGDACSVFKQLNAKVDAWYLDGFAPAKNPAMWTPALFKRMAELSSEGATIATFTAAGFVRRELEANGFKMRKTPGFGVKRERLVGTYTRDPSQTSEGTTIPRAHKKKNITWAVTPKANTHNIVVIGGGIAGSSVAYSLMQRGYNPTLVAPKQCSMTASDLPIAILAPQLMLENTIEKSFFYAAFSHAVSHPAYQKAFGPERGTEYVPTTTQERQKYIDILDQFGWEADWLHGCHEGLILPKGGSVSPKKILYELTRGVSRIQGDVDRLEKCTSGWRLIGRNGEEIMETATVILAAGAITNKILAASGLIGISGSNQHPSLRLRGGQIECVQSSAITGTEGHTKTFGGHISSEIEISDGLKIRTVGSTYDKLSDLPTPPIEPNIRARQANLAQCKKQLGVEIFEGANIESWTGVRATTPDHMPFAGPIPDWSDLSAACSNLAIDRNLPLTRPPNMKTGLYCLTGLGSKGFQYAPLLGEYLAAMISGEPSPIPLDLQPKLQPGRGFVRDIIRGIQR